MKKEKLTLISWMLSLSLLLNGCGGSNKDKKVIIGNGGIYSNKVVYSKDNIEGKISAKNMEYIKLLTFTVRNVTFTKIIGIKSANNGGYVHNVYTDLDTGVTMIDYIVDDCGKIFSYTLGEDLTIVSEEEILPYLHEAGLFQDDYDVNDVITFFHDKIEPNLETSQTRVLEK